VNQLPIWLSVLSALLAAGAGFLYGRRLHGRAFSIAARIRVRDCPLLPVAMLLFVGLHVATATLLQYPSIGWHLPVPIEYYLTASMTALKIGFVAFAMMAVTVAGFLERHPSRVLLLIASVAAVVTVDGLARRAARPNLEPLQARESEGVILQSTSSTCAAAAGATIATSLGIPASEERMVELMNTTWAGTSPAQIIYGLRAVGLAAKKVEIDGRDLNEVSPPAILLVNFGDQRDGHAVAYMGPNGDQFNIWDPGPGRSLWTREVVESRWEGRAIEVSSPQISNQ